MHHESCIWWGLNHLDLRLNHELGMDFRWSCLKIEFMRSGGVLKTLTNWDLPIKYDQTHLTADDYKSDSFTFWNNIL